MLLGLLAIGIMFGPSLAAFATSRPVVPVPIRPRVPVIQAQPFSRVDHDFCVDGGGLRLGPVEKTKGLFYEAALQERLTEAARRCLSGSGYLTVSASVDPKGNLRAFEADSGSDAAPAACARSFMRTEGPVETRGPGTMRIGFFTGRPR